MQRRRYPDVGTHAAHAALAALLTLGGGCGTVEVQGLGLIADEPAGGAGGQAPVLCTTPLAERIQSTILPLGAAAMPSDEYTPIVVAPTADGGSLLAWRAAGSEEIRVTRLDANDLPLDTSPPFPGLEVHALVAHEQGGGAMVVLSKDPTIEDETYCATSLTPYCARLDLVRFDGAGEPLWQTKLTDDVPVGTPGALFIYWYQHTARLVFADDTYGVYFRSASSTESATEATGVDLHAGDTFRFVTSDGTRLDGGWRWGCSHSWSVRLAFDGLWAAACHGDPYPNGMRVTLLDPTGTRETAMLSEGIEPTRRALGGLVPRDGGFWLSHVAPDDTDALAVYLARVSASGAVQSNVAVTGAATPLDDSYPFRAYMAAYDGPDRFLLGFKSGGGLLAGVIDETGRLVEELVPLSAPIDNFSEFVTTPDGDVIWAHSAGGDEGVTVTRVQACDTTPPR